jgi:hypothetical protein
MAKDSEVLKDVFPSQPIRNAVLNRAGDGYFSAKAIESFNETGRDRQKVTGFDWAFLT